MLPTLPAGAARGGRGRCTCSAARTDRSTPAARTIWRGAWGRTGAARSSTRAAGARSSSPTASRSPIAARRCAGRRRSSGSRDRPSWRCVRRRDGRTRARHPRTGRLRLAVRASSRARRPRERPGVRRPGMRRPGVRRPGGRKNDPQRSARRSASRQPPRARQTRQQHQTRSPPRSRPGARAKPKPKPRPPSAPRPPQRRPRRPILLYAPPRRSAGSVPPNPRRPGNAAGPRKPLQHEEINKQKPMIRCSPHDDAYRKRPG